MPRDTRGPEKLAELLAQRAAIDKQIEDVIRASWGEWWEGQAVKLAAALGLSKAQFYKRYGHLNPNTDWKRRRESH